MKRSRRTVGRSVAFVAFLSLAGSGAAVEFSRAQRTPSALTLPSVPFAPAARTSAIAVLLTQATEAAPKPKAPKRQAAARSAATASPDTADKCEPSSKVDTTGKCVPAESAGSEPATTAAPPATAGAETTDDKADTTTRTDAGKADTKSRRANSEASKKSKRAKSESTVDDQPAQKNDPAARPQPPNAQNTAASETATPQGSARGAMKREPLATGASSNTGVPKEIAAAPSGPMKVDATPSSEPQPDTAKADPAAEAEPAKSNSTAEAKPAKGEGRKPGANARVEKQGKTKTGTRLTRKTKFDKASLRAATESGEDVVVEETTSSEDLQAIETSRQQAQTAAANIDKQKVVAVKEEVVTNATTRSSGEEAAAVPAAKAGKVSSSKTNTATPASPVREKDDNPTWKWAGAAAIGAVVGALIPQLGGRVVQDQGDRMIVERDGEFYVRKDENLLLRRPGVRVQTEEFEGGIVRTTVKRDDGSRVVTVRDSGGFILKRTRILADGTQFSLIDETDRPRERRLRYIDPDRSRAGYNRAADRRYDDLDYSRSNRAELRTALMRTPVQPIEGTYTLRDVRENGDLRTLVPGVDLDTVHFDTGSSAINYLQAQALQEVGRTMAAIIADNPREVFLVEGHTDAVGSNLTNLALSDRRAEAVALALTEYYGVPPENLVVQGYGERYLKVDTDGPNESNRRATVRRITPLIHRDAPG